MSQPFRRRPLHEEVAEHLRELITNDTLVEGSHIDEPALCRSLEISRTPLREALKVLQAEGLVVIEPNRGARVSIIGADELEHLFEVLAGLERQAAELACERASDNELAQLAILQEKMDQCFEAADRPGYFSACQATHQVVITLASNRVLAATHQLLVTRTRRARFRAIVAPHRWQQSLSEHRQLTSALLSRNARSAGEALRQHVQRSGEAIVASLRNPVSAQD